jgi:hypothetical protein
MLKTQKAVAHAARAPQLFGFWFLLLIECKCDRISPKIDRQKRKNNSQLLNLRV